LCWGCTSADFVRCSCSNSATRPPTGPGPVVPLGFTPRATADAPFGFAAGASARARRPRACSRAPSIVRPCGGVARPLLCRGFRVL
jgi:hypothetical protein